ncbi:Predicted kinase, aminoglycoside phosphotransferase (APT) family [Haloechinothrix alba]|uniref:Predicted kinase, aminoglycoside phosphotransferase (APT) family n=1 Tax=Haloechinothrix alba TaxID=664784 RepID=A0A239A6R1_9PSEU|nr:phosphotransferase family protein [Haloechinothrix alba]SNR91112.1 Predicted kinase, aminoglycoside phosphotransferase (APT) family [Haloechinothrix alba]
MTSADPESVALVTKLLREFMTRRLGESAEVSVTGLKRSGQGSSCENWPFDATWRRQDGTTTHKELLLRRDPPHSVADTGRAIEFDLLKNLEHTSVPAPVVHWLDDGGTELLRPSMVVDRYAGTADRAVLRDKDPLKLADDGRLALAREICDTLADVHQVNIAESGLCDVLPAPRVSPAEDELLHWEQQLNSAELEPQPVLRWALRWLCDHIPPPPDRLTLVHGDFRPANVLVNHGHVEVLLDWELAHLGDPLDDVGWYSAPLYRSEHFIPGVWEQRDFLCRYVEHTGFEVDPEALRFWQTLTIFRLAVIALQGVRIFCEGESDRPAGPLPKVLTEQLVAVLTEKTQ